MKRIISIILSVFFVTMTEPLIFAKTNEITLNDKECIMREYKEAVLEYNRKTFNEVAGLEKDKSLSNIQSNTVSALKNAGYDAYDVNPQTFSNVESVLQTDLEAAGLNPNYSYIILIDGEENNTNSRSAVSPSFTHNYNGTTYTLRWMTMYATDDPLMAKASDVNVLASSSTIIQNCLDAAISTYISSVNKYLGTIATICGLSLGDFAPAKTATMRLNGGTNWTRRFTQVWSSYDNAWLNGCCVEEVTALSYMNGSYYDASTNRYTLVPENKKYDTRYSSKFNDDQWRKNYAVIGYLNSGIQWDIVGDVVYKYNGTTKITHRHDF